MDQIASMRVFLRVAEAQNFSVAARELNMSQPTVSRHIGALEERLGVKLIRRSTRKLALSDLGVQYYENCRAVIDEIDDIEARIKGKSASPSGKIVISMPTALGRLKIMPHIWRYLMRNSAIQLDVRFEDQQSDFVTEGVDLAIRSGVPRNSALISRKLAIVPRFVVASPHYVRKFGAPKSPEALNDHDCIVYSLAPNYNEWIFEPTPGDRKAVSVSGRIKVNSPEAAVQGALEGFGVTVSPLWLVRDLISSDKLVRLLDAFPVNPYEVHAVFPDRRFIQSRVRSLIDFLVSELPKEL